MEASPQNGCRAHLAIQGSAPNVATGKASNQVLFLCIHDDCVDRFLVDKRFDKLATHHVPQLHNEDKIYLCDCNFGVVVCMVA